MLCICNNENVKNYKTLDVNRFPVMRGNHVHMT